MGRTRSLGLRILFIIAVIAGYGFSSYVCLNEKAQNIEITQQHNEVDNPSSSFIDTFSEEQLTAHTTALEATNPTVIRFASLSPFIATRYVSLPWMPPQA